MTNRTCKIQRFGLLRGIILLIVILLPSFLCAKNYPKLLKEVSVGMDSTLVSQILGKPTRMVEVNRFFYGTDQVVIANSQVIDIRIKHRIRPSISGLKPIQKQRPVSILRIGMSANEVLDLAGVPNVEEMGFDLYYTPRHRVELSEGIVREVEVHIKKSMDILDWIRLNFTGGSLLIMNITIAFIMFGVALEIKVKQLKDVVTKPKSFVVGFVSQFVALPAVTFLLVLIIEPAPSVALGMILVAACPGGNVSNFISSYAKANIELSVTLTAIATIGAIVFTPLNFALWGNLYSGTADLVIPIKIDAWEMMKTVLILLGIPIVAGVWFSTKFPVFTKKIVKPLKIFSIIAFTGFIAAAFSSNFKFFIEYIHFIILIVFAHNLLALLTGYSLATLFGVSSPDRRSITIETGIQNSGLGLVLIFNPNLFNGLGGMAFVAAWWGIWHIIAGLGIASYWSRKGVKI